MPLGTSLGAYFQDELHLHMNPYLKEPQKTPDNNEEGTPSIEDKMDYEPTYWKVKENLPNIEDRRDESVLTDAARYLSPNWLGDKLSAMMENPMPGTMGQTWTAREPVTETPLGIDLGLRDIK